LVPGCGGCGTGAPMALAAAGRCGAYGPDRAAGHLFVAPGQVTPDCRVRDACMVCGRPRAEHEEWWADE
jgi:hypothetical protein